MRKRKGDMWVWALAGIATYLTLLVVMASDHAATDYRQARQVQDLDGARNAPVTVVSRRV